MILKILIILIFLNGCAAKVQTGVISGCGAYIINDLNEIICIESELL